MKKNGKECENGGGGRGGWKSKIKKCEIIFEQPLMENEPVKMNMIFFPPTTREKSVTERFNSRFFRDYQVARPMVLYNKIHWAIFSLLRYLARVGPLCYSILSDQTSTDIITQPRRISNNQSNYSKHCHNSNKRRSFKLEWCASLFIYLMYVSHLRHWLYEIRLLARRSLGHC